jgi:uncharacterized protein YbjT (DUF2867 family)
MSHKILLVGAAGWLGGQILDALVARGGDVRVLLRGGDDHPKAKAIQGKAEIIAGDLNDAASLDAATRGVQTIVSAVQGGPDVIIAGQVALAKAGLNNGATRILPSDFSVALNGVSPERHLFLGWRAEADRQIAALGLAQINVLNGAFMEMLLQPFFGLLDVENGVVAYWGDADQLYDFTATPDVAAAVAAVALDEGVKPGAFMIAGDTKSPRELSALASSVYGRPFALKANGSLADLDAEIARRQAQDPQDPMAWAGLQYHRLMATGEGKLRNLRAPPAGRVWTRIDEYLESATRAKH